MMFHPGVTAPPGTNTYAATFEAFLVNTSTGVEVPGSSTGPFTLNWTTVPDGRPALNIAQKMVIAWPATATNCVLECADTLRRLRLERGDQHPRAGGRPAGRDPGRERSAEVLPHEDRAHEVRPLARRRPERSRPRGQARLRPPASR